ncbi:hypothetical protein ACFLXV_01690 [Chloroflexota bacterium]
MYENRLGELNDADFMPKTPGTTVKIICSHKEADELANTTGVDIRLHFTNARNCLDSGAIATCILADGAIAHLGWLALNDKAQKAISNLPQKVIFLNGGAFAGGGLTMPEYRGNGLLGYGSYIRLRLLRERGVAVLRYAVSERNTVAQTALAKFTPTLYARARYLKVLWWKYWKEIPAS